MHEHCAFGRIATAESLADQEHIGNHALMLTGEPVSGAPHSSDDFVDDQQDIQAITHFPQFSERAVVLLEGTFRDPEMVCGTTERFAAAGFRVEVVAVATPSPVSRFEAEQRYLGATHPIQARWTPPEAHEVALAVSLASSRHLKHRERSRRCKCIWADPIF